MYGSDERADLSALEASSSFERRCLCRRACQCEELLQLAVLGLETAQERRHGAREELFEIAQLLREAVQVVERAHEIAATLVR